MVNNYKYKLDTSSKKFNCPKCQKKKFVRYIISDTNEYMHSNYGRCDREVSCSYHNSPYKDESLKNETSYNWKPLKVKPKNKNVFIPTEILKQTYKGYDKNVFIQNLLSNVTYPFDKEDIEEVIKLYHLGTVIHGYRTGAITLPFIDSNQNIRAIQVKQFNNLNKTIGTDYIHSIIDKHYNKHNKPLPKWLIDYNKNETKVSCLFGEHLINNYPNNPIALVEAPKTAIYGTLYYGLPKDKNSLIWLAVYNSSSFSLKKCTPLKNRTILLFPDLSKDGTTFKKWKHKAREIEKDLDNTKFFVSTLLEDNACELDRIEGLDLADYLIKLNWRVFRN